MTAVKRIAAFLPEDQLYGFSWSSSSHEMMVSSPSSMKPKLVMLLARGSWEGAPCGFTTVVGFSWKEEDDEELACSLMGIVAGSGKLVLGTVRLVSRNGHYTLGGDYLRLTTGAAPY